MKKLIYSYENVNKVINLLNSIDTRGLKNAQAIVQIAALLTSGEDVDVIKPETGGKE